MTTIKDQKTAIITELSLLASSLITNRADVINKAILATAMRDSQSTALTTNDYQQTGEELGAQRTLLKSGDLLDQIKYHFQTIAGYQEALGFDLPQVDQFGYSLLDNDGNILPLIDASSDLDSHFNNFYLVKSIATQELVSIDDDLAPYVSPQTAEDVIEFVQAVKSEESNIVFTLANVPIIRSTGASLTIFASDFISSASEEQIGSVDSAGAVTNSSSNTLGILIDESASSMNYDSKEIDLTFSSLPSAETTITVKYDYVNSAVPASENHTEFDIGCSLGFSRILSSTPVIESIVVYLDGTKKAITNSLGRIYSMDVNLAESFFVINTDQVRVRFDDVISEGSHVVRFDYTIKDEIAATEDIGNLTASSIVLPNFNPANGEIILETVRILDGTTEIATSDSLGNITGTYATVTSGETGTITGTIDSSAGLDLTLTAQSGGLAFPAADLVINLEYDMTIGLRDWEATYDKVNITALTTNSNDVDIIHVDSGELAEPPTLYKTYPIKRFSDHQIYGNVIITTEGVKLNSDWLPVYIRNDGVISAASSDNDFTSADFNTSGFVDNVHVGQTLRIYDYNSTDFEEFTIASHTGDTLEISDIGGFPVSGSGLKFEIIWPVEDASEFDDKEFETFMTWLDPDRQYLDDILKSSNPDTVSFQGNEETSSSAGQVYDSGPNGLHGTMRVDPVFGRGPFSNSHEFDGVLRRGSTTNSVVTVPDNALLSPTEITVEAWIKPENSHANGNIMSKNHNSEWRFRFNSDDQVIQFLDIGGTNSATTSETVPYRKWSHIACTGDSTGLKIFINGIESALVESSTLAYASPVTSGDLWLGATNGGTNELFKGWATEFRIWDHARTSAQILEFKDKELVGDETGLVGYWRTNGSDPYIEVDPFFPAEV